jgi:lipid II:glycine glycyltransferase (peptidoglycan interpeptide bridge formation enzyme)
MLLNELEKKAPGRLKLVEVYASQSLHCFEGLGYIKRRNENMLVALDAPLQTLWTRLTQSRRHGVRFASRRGVVISKANGFGDFQKFYDLYVLTAKRVGFRPTEQQHLQKILQILENSDHPSALLLARYQEKAVAAGLLICCRSGWATWDIGCSDPEFRRLRPNDALIWEMIRLSHDSGSILLNLGEGNYGFKGQFGGRPVPINRYVKTVLPTAVQSGYRWLNSHPLAKYALFIASDSLPSMRRSMARMFPHLGES